MDHPGPEDRHPASTARTPDSRTHTSPGQIHVMRNAAPPIRALLPGRCFRYEAIDIPSNAMFGPKNTRTLAQWRWVLRGNRPPTGL